MLAKGHGTDHPGIGRCGRHGGSTRNHRQGANVQKAALAVAEFVPDAPASVHYHEVLRTALSHRWAVVGFLRAQIAGLESSADLKQRDLTGRFEKPAVWVEMYDQWLSAATALAKTCHDVGMDEYDRGLSENTGRQFSELVRGILDDFSAALVALGIRADVIAEAQCDELPDIIRRRLLSLAVDADTPPRRVP